MRRAKDHPPETRREYNARFGVETDEYESEYDWPEAGDYLWDAFHDIARDRTYDNGHAQPLGVLLIRAHFPDMLDEEVAILRDMDAAWLNATTAEHASGV